MRLILIQHAQTTANVTYTMSTVIPGPELTALGQRQAAALPEAPVDEKLDTIYASAHRRTEHTAAPLADERGLAVAVRPGIRGVSAGRWEAASDHASDTLFLNLVLGWPANPTTRVPSRENRQEVLQRFDNNGMAIAELDDGTWHHLARGSGLGRSGTRFRQRLCTGEPFLFSAIFASCTVGL